MLVANPDGYQYTFDHERLWRKNLHDNDGDGQITRGDGVDPNRNYNVDWGYDNEGSSTQFSADDYRGTGPASEPETQAQQGLIDRLKFKFLITYHSYGPLILYPYGLADADAVGGRPALRRATRGSTRHPAISGFDPGVGADLYITNGDDRRLLVREDRHAVVDGRAGRGLRRLRVRVPRRRGARRRPSSRRTCRSRSTSRSRRPNPGQPVSHLGNTVKPFYLDMGKDGKPPDGPIPRRRTTPRSTSRSPSRTATRSRCGCSPSAT